MDRIGDTFKDWLESIATSAANEPVILDDVNSLREAFAGKVSPDSALESEWLSIALKQSKAVFTCSGHVPIGAKQHQSGDAVPMRMVFERPISVTNERSDYVAGEVSAYRLKLPLPSSLLQSEIDVIMSRVVSLCHPATFGVGGNAVLDPSYRSCDQLAPDAFTFTPIENMPNVIHEIMRVLCPTHSDPLLRAELYKLNIYSVGGTFKSHRDTPRSSTMIGSLVMCLPIPHQGGTLVVRHPTNGQSVNYEWELDAGDEKKLQQIEWCAFYGDCEHEILPVTSGHRMTLTYNLYLDENDVKSEQPVSATPVVDRHAHLLRAPFAALLRLLLRTSSFMSSGGKLGIYCHHGYAHTSASMVQTLTPCMLKGGDAMIYEIACTLGLKCEFVPVINYDIVLPKFEKIDTSCRMAYEDSDDDDAEWYDLDGEAGDKVRKVMGHQMTPGIVWLNDGGVRELQEAHAAYGNEPTMGTYYSKATLIITIDRYDPSIMSRNPEPLNIDVPVTCTIDLHPHPLEKKLTHKRFRCNLCPPDDSSWETRQRWECSVCGKFVICFRCQANPVDQSLPPVQPAHTVSQFITRNMFDQPLSYSHYQNIRPHYSLFDNQADNQMPFYSSNQSIEPSKQVSEAADRLSTMMNQTTNMSSPSINSGFTHLPVSVSQFPFQHDIQSTLDQQYAFVNPQPTSQATHQPNLLFGMGNPSSTLDQQYAFVNPQPTNQATHQPNLLFGMANPSSTGQPSDQARSQLLQAMQNPDISRLYDHPAKKCNNAYCYCWKE